MADEENKKYDVDILAVIDMQNDFIGGVLKNDTAKKVIPAVVEEIRQWKGTVIATRDTHFKESYADSVEGKLLPFHCEYGTEGWQIESTIMISN